MANKPLNSDHKTSADLLSMPSAQKSLGNYWQLPRSFAAG